MPLRIRQLTSANHTDAQNVCNFPQINKQTKNDLDLKSDKYYRKANNQNVNRNCDERIHHNTSSLYVRTYVRTSQSS